MSAVTAVLSAPNSAFVFNDTITTNTLNYDLTTKLTAAGWNGIDTVLANISIGTSSNTTVLLGSNSISTPALAIAAPRARSLINITNYGYILGKGGNASGGAGGPAVTVSAMAVGMVMFANYGTIGGGGGGGGSGTGAGAYDAYSASYSYMYGGGGGGGAGYLPGTGSNIVGTRQNVNLAFSGATAGSDGSNTTGGAGGGRDNGFAFGTSPNTYMGGGSGGAGGGLGAAGSAGSDGSWAGENGFAYPIVRNPTYTSGGAAGACTTSGSNAYITWAVAGTRYGSLL